MTVSIFKIVEPTSMQGIFILLLAWKKGEEER